MNAHMRRYLEEDWEEVATVSRKPVKPVKPGSARRPQEAQWDRSPVSKQQRPRDKALSRDRRA